MGLFDNLNKNKTKANNKVTGFVPVEMLPLVSPTNDNIENLVSKIEGLKLDVNKNDDGEAEDKNYTFPAKNWETGEDKAHDKTNLVFYFRPVQKKIYKDEPSDVALNTIKDQIFNITVPVEPEERPISKKGKYCYINDACEVQWVPDGMDPVINNEDPYNTDALYVTKFRDTDSNGNTLNYHKARIGEWELINFIDSILGSSGGYYLDLDKVFSGDLSQIRELIAGAIQYATSEKNDMSIFGRVQLAQYNDKDYLKQTFIPKVGKTEINKQLRNDAKRGATKYLHKGNALQIVNYSDFAISAPSVEAGESSGFPTTKSDDDLPF